MATTGRSGDAKRATRATLRDARAGLGADVRAQATRDVTARALSLPETASPRGVLGYAATPEEIDPALLLRALRERGARIAYPRVCGPGRLALHWVSETDLAPGYCGIAEPPESAPIADPADLDLVIVPGVAFDGACNRLGHGGGFYDRLLSAAPSGMVAVALGFDEQVVEELPVEAHDMCVDVLVTPSRVIRRT